MRAPARLFGFSLIVFIALTLLLSRLESETVTRTINKFPSIKQQWQARAAAMQSHFSAGAAPDAAACDVDAKSCSEPYTSPDGSSSKAAKVKQMSDQTSDREYENEEAMESGPKDAKNRHPSTKDAGRDKDRGFTDAEQAAALERLEFKYGSEAKQDTSLLWMETSTTTTGWKTDPTAALDSEAERARIRLGEEYGDVATTTTGTAAAGKSTGKGTGTRTNTATGKGATAATTTTEGSEPTEKGWRTTGFETKAKTTQKSLISGGGGNGTATATDFPRETGEGELVDEDREDAEEDEEEDVDEDVDEEPAAAITMTTATEIETETAIATKRVTKPLKGVGAERFRMTETLKPTTTVIPGIDDNAGEGIVEQMSDRFEEDERAEASRQVKAVPTAKDEAEEVRKWRMAKRPVRKGRVGFFNEEQGDEGEVERGSGKGKGKAKNKEVKDDGLRV